MKKIMKATKTPEGTQRAALTEQDLAAVVGGTGGTIIVENVVGGTAPEGVGGTGKQSSI